MGVVEQVSHRVAVMYLGQVVEIGPAAAVLRDPRHSYTRRLLAAVPVADPRKRSERRLAGSTEIPSPMRPVGDPPVTPPLTPIGIGHFVQASRWVPSGSSAQEGGGPSGKLLLVR